MSRENLRLGEWQTIANAYGEIVSRLGIKDPSFILQNWDCKYLDVRVDMRTGSVLLAPGNAREAPTPQLLADCRIGIEDAHLCVRNETGWLLASRSLRERGLDWSFDDLLAEAEKNQRAWLDKDHEPPTQNARADAKRVQVLQYLRAQVLQYLSQCVVEAEQSPDGVARPGLEPLRWLVETLETILPAGSSPPIEPNGDALTEHQRHALGQLLQSAHTAGWPYYMRGGWAGEQLYPLIEAGKASPGQTQADQD